MAEQAVPRTQDTAGTLDQFDVFGLPDGKLQQAVAIGDGSNQGRIAKIGAKRSQYVATEALQLSGTSTTYSTSMTVSLGALADAAGDTLPDFGSVEVYVLNNTNQSVQSQPRLAFTGDAIAGLTPTVASGFYQPYIDPIAPGQIGIQRIALTGGYLRNVSVICPFSVAPTTGTLGVLLVFHAAGAAGTYVLDVTNNQGLRVYSENSNYTDGNGNLLMMGREYGGGGANAIVRGLHVDPDGCLLPTSARLAASATAASGSGVTATLAAPGANYSLHVTSIRITKYAAAALTGVATPVVVTTTNLPGSQAWTFGTAGAIGTVEEKSVSYDIPLRASAANTAVTIVCPATTGVIWRVNIHAYAA